ncbi:MAG TPA: maleylpyruvate isomerase N-terminal domain-containing protein [Streptosporangiaceae bacterium]|jgi:uncharacterized protein (TIGR03083 family)|nr:maleylpyruvate isomerase N-terminal domain-containing protein [Streptosporangiaceae bacterium]
MDVAALAGLNPFGILDIEADRLDRYFSGLDQAGWDRPSRAAGWSVRDVLAHLAGEELYNRACLDGDIEGFRDMVREAGIGGGYEEFNDWCVEQRRGLPVENVLAEWREASSQTRRRMAALGRDAPLMTSVGPYPAGLQAFHYCSEYATHADDVGAPVAAGEEPGRTAWRVSVGRFALAEQDSPVKTFEAERTITVVLGDVSADLAPGDFVEATVGRLPAAHPLDPEMREALRCLA